MPVGTIVKLWRHYEDSSMDSSLDSYGYWDYGYVSSTHGTAYKVVSFNDPSDISWIYKATKNVKWQIAE